MVIEQRPGTGVRVVVDNGVVLARVDLVAVGHVAREHGVLEDPEHGILAPCPGSADVAVLGDVSLRRSSRLVEDAHDGQRGAVLEIEVEDLPHHDRLEVVDHQVLVHDVVAERHRPTGPLALAPGGGDLVAGPLGDHLALELREAHEHVQREPAHRVGGGEVLRDAHEGRARPVEAVHDLGEIEQRAGQAIYLVDDEDVDLPRLDVLYQPLEGGALEVRAGEPTVVVLLGRKPPAKVGLVLDVALAGFALGVEGVELLVQPDRRGLARVDGAALHLRRRAVRSGRSSGHPFSTWLVRLRRWRPQKRNPFQLVPVMSLASFERLACRSPRYSKPSSRTVSLWSTPL